jgi:hypothetical protein
MVMRANMKSMHALSVHITFNMHCGRVSLRSIVLNEQLAYLFRHDDNLGSLDPLVYLEL